jgi:hypothetical protein
MYRPLRGLGLFWAGLPICGVNTDRRVWQFAEVTFPEGHVKTRSLLLAGLLAIVLSGSSKPKLTPDQRFRGDEWLSWSPTERHIYVVGMIDGYLRARLDACNTTDELFDVGQPHRLGHGSDPGEFPSARCLAATDTYSRFRAGDFSDSSTDIYTSVLTQFYEKHPQYRKLPFPLLVGYLRDRNFKTADQLAEIAARHGFPISMDY